MGLFGGIEGVEGGVKASGHVSSWVTDCWLKGLLCGQEVWGGGGGRRGEGGGGVEG